MLQIIEQTRDEKIAMYLKLTKRELAEMLVNADDALRNIVPHVQWYAKLGSVPDSETLQRLASHDDPAALIKQALNDEMAREVNLRALKAHNEKRALEI